MSGSILAASVAGSTILLTALVLPVGAALVEKRVIAGAADAAALAAADVASGLVPGVLCDAAARLAEANGGALSTCEVDGAVVTVGVSGSVLGIPFTIHATAGPPSND
jgi:secretion/DNA translocation related TadE-like protein